jgi:hypothetical protein
MLTIESNKVNVNHNAKEVYDFIVDLNNLEKLMPPDRVEYWKSTENTCRFGIKNLASIGMKHSELVSPNKIILESDGKNPFTFKLTIFIKEINDRVESYFEFEGDVNMFMKAMVQKPLKQFFDTLAENLPAGMDK